MEKQVTETASVANDINRVARAQQKLEHDYTRWEAAKLYPRAVMYLAIMIWAMIVVGYENQAAGMVISIPRFRQDFGHLVDGSYVLDGSWQSAITGGATAAFVIGCAIASYAVDYTGRKWMVCGALFLTMATIGMEFAATTMELFFAGKFINAVLLGIIQSGGTSYVAELTPLALRGIATASVNLAMCIGPFVCYLITNSTADRDDRWAYRAIFCSQWAFAGIGTFLVVLLPESPHHHVAKGNYDKALGSLRKIYADPGVAEAQLEIIKETYEEAQIFADSGSYLELFDKYNWKRTLLACGPFFMQPMSGLAYVGSYQTYYYQLSGFDTQKSFQISCGAQALSVSGTLTSFFLVDRFGRRFMVLYGIVSLAVLNILIAALGIRNEQSYLTASSAFLTMYNFFYNSGIGPIAYVVCSELPTGRLRTKTVSLGLAVGNALSCMWSFVLPYMFNPDQANMGSKINFIFGGCCALAIYTFYFHLPESANRSFEEVDEMFREQVPARQWRNYVSKERTEARDVFEEQVKLETVHVEYTHAAR